MYCGKCGQQNAEGQRFCNRCGDDLTKQTDGGQTGQKADTDSGWADTLDVMKTYGPESLSAGHMLGGRYRLERELGSGGMGVVWLAHDKELEMPVAAKVLPPVLARNKHAIKSLKSEAAVSLKLTHPNICRLHTFHADGEIKFLIMEYIEGKTLEEILAEQPDKKLPLDVLLPIARQIGEALDYAHSLNPPVLHRDIKPANIMVTDTGHAKLLDFGIAREIRNTMTQVTGKFDTAGTLPYMSPEQFKGSQMTAASDVYSLAAVLYEALSGQPYVTPYGDPSYQILHKPYEKVEGIPDSVNTALEKALSKDLTSRPKTVGELLKLTSNSIPSPEPLQPKPIPPISKPDQPAVLQEPRGYSQSEPSSDKRPNRRGRVFVALGAFFVLSLIIGGIVVRKNQERPSRERPYRAVETSNPTVAKVRESIPAPSPKATVRSTPTPSTPKPVAPAITQTLPGSFEEVANAAYAPLTGLASGSREAQERQKQAAQTTGWPLEIRSEKTGIVFRLVPAGSFTMGSPSGESGRDNDEGPQHQVTISKPFYMGKFEVTQGQWKRVMGNNPSHFQNAGDDAPVENVSWNDCQQFLKELCELEGVPEGTFRLPTEAQWEYACRAGTETVLYTGGLTIRGQNNGPELDPVAWYGGNSGVSYEGGNNSIGWPEKQYNHRRAGTHPVGQKHPNAFGLYDMHGNVWEWCYDWYGENYYANANHQDPQGPNTGSARVARGGSWRHGARGCRSADRDGSVPGYRINFFGFRVVLDFK